MAKISRTHHVTKNGTVKRNPNSNRIKLTKKENDNHYSIIGDYTIYAQFKKANAFYVDIPELIRKRKLIIKTLRNNGVKVSTKHNDEIINRESQRFYDDLNTYKIIETEVISRFNKIYSKGIYPPTVDNIELNNATELGWKLEKLNYRNTPISHFNELKFNVEDIQNRIEEYKKYISISI